MRTDKDPASLIARPADALRPLRATLDFVGCAEGSCLIEVGRTRVLCNASIENQIKPWLKEKDHGWITAEYALLPRSTDTRTDRERKGASGRTQEIQRLIGRSLRAVANLKPLKGWMVTVDCDVLEADGGTRTASIVGGFVALAQALQKWKVAQGIEETILTEWLSAVSVGIVEGKPLLDLDYSEDSAAQVDMNVVRTGSGRLVEVQASGEEATFTRAELNQLIDLAEKGCAELQLLQQKALGTSRLP